MAYHVLVQKTTRTDVPVILPTAPFFLAIQAYEIILSSSKTKRDTNRRRVKIVRHVPTGALRHKKIASPHLVQHPSLKILFFWFWKLPMGHSEAAARETPIYPTRLWCNPQCTHAPPRRDRRGHNTCLDIPLPGVCRSALFL